MSETKLSISRSAMNYGGMTGIMLFLVFILSSILGTKFSGLMQVMGYAALGLGIFIGSKNYRDKELNGVISYGTAFYSGFLISFFASVIIAFTIFLYIKFVDSSIIEKIMEQTEQNMLDSGRSDEEIEKAMEASQYFMNPTSMAFFSILGYTFVGTIISLVTAAFIKKEHPNSGDSFNSFIQQNQ
ncbi:MAG: DUF4199 domain-containing protein [Bacteroidetes bacterium]|nr:DUF4199 domain-containing protein [Bacteroidota bacterium]